MRNRRLTMNQRDEAQAEQVMHGSIKLLRGLFDQQPEHVKTCTLSRVCMLLRDERERQPTQPSYLWRIAPVVYGISPESL